jgi:hypothetical protein
MRTAFSTRSCRSAELRTYKETQAFKDNYSFADCACRSTSVPSEQVALCFLVG